MYEDPETLRPMFGSIALHRQVTVFPISEKTHFGLNAKRNLVKI